MFWENEPQNLIERGAELDGGRRDELLKMGPQCRPFAAKNRLQPLRKTMLELGMGGSEWVAQFSAGFPIIGSASEGGVYRRKGGPPPPISRSDRLEGDPERYEARMSSSTSPRNSRLL